MEEKRRVHIDRVPFFSLSKKSEKLWGKGGGERGERERQKRQMGSLWRSEGEEFAQQWMNRWGRGGEGEERGEKPTTCCPPLSPLSLTTQINFPFSFSLSLSHTQKLLHFVTALAHFSLIPTLSFLKHLIFWDMLAFFSFSSSSFATSSSPLTFSFPLHLSPALLLTPGRW